MKPSFDTWTVVFLIAAVQGFFVAVVLWQWKKGRSLANRLLAALLFMFAFTLCEYVLWWTRHINAFPHMAQASFQLPLLFGPILFFYLRSIYENTPLRRADAWHLLPFALVMLAHTPYYIMDEVGKRAIVEGNLRMPLPFWAMFAANRLRILHLLAYAGWNFWYIRRQARVGESDRWAKWLNACFAGFALAYLSYFILVRFPFFNASWDYHISAVMTVFIYLIAWAGYVQPAVFEGFAISEPNGPAKYRNSGLTLSASQSLAARLATLMEVEKLYLAPELRLDDLAQRLETGKHHVSQVINEQFGMSFFEYINNLRIREAQQMLAATRKQEMNVIEVAYAVGFNNKVSFNNTFKKVTGMTPTEFRKNATS